MNTSNGTEPPKRLTVFELLRQTARFVSEHEVITRASAIAFSGMMAAVPFLALLLTVLVQMLPEISTGPIGAGGGIGTLSVQQLDGALQSMFPQEAYLVVKDQIARIQRQPPLTIISISLAITLWAASSVFRGIIDGINRVYGVVEARPYWRVWLLSMWMTVVQLAIVIASLLLIIFWPAVVQYFQLDGSAWLWTTGSRWFMVISAVMISFALIFHMGPNSAQSHRWVTPGSVVGTALFLMTCHGSRLYVQGFANYDKTYGSLGGVMMLLLWFYLSSLVLLIAAEINRIFDYAAKRRAEYKAHCK